MNDAPASETLWSDYGKDFYATISFSDIPPTDGRRIWMAWMSNWLYANEEPTSPWRGALSLPRELSLRRTPAGLRLVQRPVRELESAADGSGARAGRGIDGASGGSGVHAGRVCIDRRRAGRAGTVGPGFSPAGFGCQTTVGKRC